MLGAGNNGNVYRIESPVLYTALLTMPSTQITAFQSGPDGRLYAATGNVGKVYEIGPGLEHEGTIESDVFDAAMHSLWGRLSFEARLNGGQVAIAARSGNLDQPQKNWSPWSAAVAETPSTAKGGRVPSPAARFVQWRATLDGRPRRTLAGTGIGGSGVPAGERRAADRRDRDHPVELQIPNAPVSPLALLQAPSQSLTLPPLGRRPSSSGPSAPSENATTTPAMQFAKGFVGARWVASDPNGDSLIYTVEIRGVNETEWKPLKEKLPEKYFSWDSTAFPDGEYRLRDHGLRRALESARARR